MSLRLKILSGILLLVLCSALYSWYSPSTEGPKVFTQQVQAKAVSKVGKEVITPKKLEVYKNPEVYKKVNLPDEVKKNPSTKVLSVVDTGKSKTGTTVATVVDIETGKVDTFTKEIPRSLMGFENEKSVGLGASVSSRGYQVVDLHANYTFVRLGNIYGSIRGELNMPLSVGTPEAKVGVTADYRFNGW
jgi:hypothetical protein